MKKTILLIAVVLSCLMSAAQNKFSNPVIKGNYADPTMFKVGDTFYCCATSGDLCPVYPIFKSSDLVNWEQIGNVFNQKPQWTKGSFWAPEMWEHDGQYYIYYTAKRASDGISCVGVATAPRPEGPYTDHGIIVDWDKEAIDACVIEDDGKQYICWKAYGLDQRPIELLACKLSEDGLKLDGEVFSILKDDDRLLCEGQQWFKHGEWYYIIYAIRDCCSIKSDYAVSVARSRTLEGPYEKYSDNPILKGAGPVQSLGHGTGVWTDDGRFFYLCHAYFKGEQFRLGRQPVLHELLVNDEGWIVCKSGKNAAITLEVPFHGVLQARDYGFEDKFNKGKLDPAWVWNLRGEEPEYDFASGKLALEGRLNLRARSVHYEFEAYLNCDKKNCAGICFSTGKMVYRLGVSGKETVLQELSPEGEIKVLASSKTRGSAFRFKIRKNGVEAYYSTNGDKWTLLSSFDKGEAVALMPGIFAEKEANFEYFCMKPGI